MTVQSLRQLCAELGIVLALKGDNNDRLVVDAPKGALTEPLRQALTEHKAALISMLKGQTESFDVASFASVPSHESGSLPAHQESMSATQFTQNTATDDQPVSAAPSSFEKTSAEIRKLLSGTAYDANIVDANDASTRQTIATQLLAAISARNPEQYDHARRAFMNHGYFDDATRQLRTAENPTDRAGAARQLGIVGDYKATTHLVASLNDSGPEVRRASIEALGQIGDAAAIAPLEELLSRETNPQVPEAVIRHAINSITVTVAKRNPNLHKPSLRAVEKQSSTADSQPQKREIFADYLSSFEQREAPVVEEPPPPQAATNLEASVERLFLEERALKQAREDLEQRRLEADAARRMVEDEARIKTEHEAQIRMEVEARLRAEEETRRQMIAETSRQKAEEETRIQAEMEARKRAEEEERFRREAETLRKAAEELAQKRAEAAAARQRAEDKEARRRAEEDAKLRAAEEEKRRVAEEDRLRAEAEARRRAEEELRRRVADEIRRREEEEARLKAEEAARVRAAEEARLRAEVEERLRVEEEQKRQAEEAASKAEAERLRAAEEARRHAEEERWRREAEEQHRLEEARLRVEQETLMQVAAELSRRRSEVEEARQNAEREARLLVEAQERTKVEEESRRQMELERQRLELEERRRADAEYFAEVERQSEAERQLIAEQHRLKAEHEERHLSELNSVKMIAEQEAKQRHEHEQRIRAEILGLSEAEEQQRLRMETEMKRREELQARLDEHTARAQEEAARVDEIKMKAEEEGRRREELQARLKEEEARLQRETEAREQAQRLMEEVRLKAEEEAQRRAEVEANLQEEERRLHIEQEARIRAEADAYRLAEEARLKAQAAAASRAQIEARLQDEEARLKAEEEARSKAEAEALRLAEERRRVEAENEARRLAEYEAQLKTETAEDVANKEARVLEATHSPRQTRQTKSFSDASTTTTASHLSSVESDTKQDLAESGETSFHFNLLPESHGEVAWAEEDKTEQPQVLDALPVLDDAVVTSQASAGEPTLEPAKAIDVVFSEKGIASAEDGAGIPSEILTRLGSVQPSERAEALAEVVAIGGDDAFRCISKAFDDQVVEVRNAAARSLFNLQPDRAATFTRALREGSPERRRKIGQALAGSGLAGEAISNLTGESREKTYDAFSLLFLMAKAGEVQPLMQAIEDYPNVEVRIAVVKLLALSGQPEIIPSFRRLAVRGSLPSEVRSAVMEAIYQISSQARESAPSAA